MAKDSMTKSRGGSYLKMCWPNGEDSMSSSPWTVVDVGMCGASATPKVGYMNGSDGVAPLCHVDTFSGAFSDCRRSLLISLRTRRCMPLTELLKRRGGLFLNSASTLFFRGDKSGSGELPEDNSSSAAASLSPGRMGSLPLFCLTGGAGWLLPCVFSPRSSSKRARRQSLSCCEWSARFHNSVIYWLTLLASSPYRDASEEVGPQGTDLLGYLTNQMSERELPNFWGVRDRLIADVVSHVADETFCLVVPTDGANCYLSNSQSHWIVGTLT